jgi:[ribosomal protein S18]-alanine N-acetyltransferase
MREKTSTTPMLTSIGPFDLAVAAAIHAACFDDAWNDSAIAELLAMPGSFGYLATISDTSVGFAMALLLGEEAEILTLAVLPDFRRRGLGRCMLTTIVARCEQAGRSRLYLEVAEDNAAARELYRTAGFTAVGRRPGYYRRGQGSAVAAVVLARTINPDRVAPAPPLGNRW